MEITLNAASFFSADYKTARERFLDAVNRLGLPIESHVLAAKGPAGEPLAIDVATIEPPNWQRVVIVSSGLHGVEGFFGSAVQLAWLAQFDRTVGLPGPIKVILVHTLNPYGFAWLRRCNESNVDLNRNFLSDRQFLSAPEYLDSLHAYERLSYFLNPARRPSRWEPYTLEAICGILAEGWSVRRRMNASERPFVLSIGAIKKLGLAELQKVLPVGQYEHERGLFYGGSGPEETTGWLQQRLPTWIAGSDLTIHLDFHTGLGKRGDCKLLVVDEAGSPRAEWLANQFGREVVEAGAGPTSYSANGTLAGYFQNRQGGSSYHGITAEFGTYPGMRVLGALRAENQAHFYARPESNCSKWAKQQILEVFVPSATDWRETVVSKALTIIERALGI